MKAENTSLRETADSQDSVNVESLILKAWAGNTPVSGKELVSSKHNLRLT